MAETVRGTGATETAGGRLARAAATAWIDRWDAQQQVYLPDREERFTALIDAVQECAGRPDPLVLDLGCGPGSLAVRLLRQIPAATVVAIDADPLLLALGQAAWADGLPGTSADGRPAGSLRFADQDLRVPGWSGALGLDGPADAAVSTTALHWLPPDALAAMYAEVATVLRPGGLLLNGDHLAEDEATAPTLVRLGRALNEREERRRAPHGRAETWAGWWDAVQADPALADLVAERQRRSPDSEHHGSPSGWLSVHVEALRAAGFAEVGTIWQRGDNRLLCGVLGS
ncbi:MAG TPA: class I SAM-dependent methyltransferase [Streptosporangiaceae bacterium]|nr:class I SAM-dependent methyltransferase [Streptosporangiaceae bacterium]